MFFLNSLIYLKVLSKDGHVIFSDTTLNLHIKCVECEIFYKVFSTCIHSDPRHIRYGSTNSVNKIAQHQPVIRIGRHPRLFQIRFDGYVQI